VRERRLLSASSASNIAPFDCSANSLPIQVKLNDAETAYDVLELNIETGAYSKIYDIPLTRTNPAMELELNSAGISPADSKPYVTVAVKPGPGQKAYYLTRFDKNKLEFVGKLPLPTTFHKKAIGYNTAAFSMSGDYYLVTKGNSQHMSAIKGLHNLDGHSSQSTVPDLTLNGFSLGATNWIADMAVVPGDFDKTGKILDYAFMLDKLKLHLVKVTSETPSTWNIWKLAVTGDGWQGARADGFGAAWSYKNRVFFAANNGRGVFEVDKDTIDLIGLSVTINYVGKSDPTINNDGMNCLELESPWPDQGECDSGFVQVDAVNGQCPSGSMQQ